jgi:hypothetical protein
VKDHIWRRAAELGSRLALRQALRDAEMRYIKSRTAALRKVGGPAAVVIAFVAIEVLAALYGGP